jgi:hypothetical protein
LTVISATKPQKLPLVEVEGDPQSAPPTGRADQAFRADAAFVQSPDFRPETRALLACVRARFASENLDELSSLIAEVNDWKYMIEAANYHGVLPLIQQSLTAVDATAVPPEVFENIQLRCRANAQNNLHLTRALLQLLSAFEDQSIAAVPYKGPILAALAYGNLSLRQFCDLDILVREYDILKAMDVLTKQGYRLQLPPDQVTPIPELLKSKKDFRFVSADQRVVVELHWRLAGKHFYFPFSLEELWPRLDSVSLSGTQVLRIRPEELLVILCAHGSKHLWGRLLWICDVAQLIRANPNLDWATVMRRARKCRSQRMLLLGLRLAQIVLGSELPASVTGAIRSDRRIDPLARDLIAQFIASDIADADRHAHAVAVYPWHIKMRERLTDKAKLAFQYFRGYVSAAMVPNAADRDHYPLPARLSFLYYVLHPFRLVSRMSRSRRRRNQA